MKQTTTIAVGIIFVVLAATMIGGCIGAPELGSSGSEYGTGSFVILNDEMVAKDFGYLHVVGDVKNTGKSVLETAHVKVTFYDENGAVVGEGEGMVGDIWPGETCDFDVMYQGGKQQLVTRSGNGYTVEIAHPIYDNRR